MRFAGARLSASHVTVIFEAVGGKTRMTFTAQAAMLAAGSAARDQRIVGTGEGMDRFVEIAGKRQSDRTTRFLVSAPRHPLQ